MNYSYNIIDRHIYLLDKIVILFTKVNFHTTFEMDEPLDKTINFDYLPKLYITSGIVCLTMKNPFKYSAIIHYENTPM